MIVLLLLILLVVCERRSVGEGDRLAYRFESGEDSGFAIFSLFGMGFYFSITGLG